MRLTIVFMALSFLSVKTSVMCNEPKGEITVSQDVKERLTIL